MIQSKDVILKDEGKFITVFCQTEKAKKAIANQVEKECLDESGTKFDIKPSSKSNMQALLVSHSLTWDEF
jgi:hypothetical protein